MHLNHVSRKAAGDDGNESDEEVKRGKMVILLFFSANLYESPAF
jgi:hypothetical protein